MRSQPCCRRTRTIDRPRRMSTRPERCRHREITAWHVGRSPVIDRRAMYRNSTTPSSSLNGLAEFERNDVVPHYQSLCRTEEATGRRYAREDLRLEEFRPRVLTSFVRNKPDRPPSTCHWSVTTWPSQMGVAGEAKADRPDGPAAADFAAGIRQNDADGIHRQPARHHLHENQRPRHRTSRSLRSIRPKRPMPAPAKKSKSSTCRWRWATT